MSIDDFLDFMPETVTIAPFSSRDSYNVPTHGTAVSFAARVVKKQQLVRAGDGSERISTGHAWIGGTPSMTTEDKLTLADGTVPEVLAVESLPDEDGDHHVKIFFA